MTGKKSSEQVFNPAKYHMNFCHECHGLGKTLNNKNSTNKQDSLVVCPICGGFGLVKKQGSGFEEEVGT